VFDLVAFYATVSGLSFTLLGLWWVVAERRRTWFDNAHHRRMAYVVSLHFMLPGAMSVLSLVDSTGTFFWRLVFALAGIAGMVGALMVSSTITSELGQRRLAGVMLWIALPVYALVVAVAAVPDLADREHGATPARGDPGRARPAARDQRRLVPVHRAGPVGVMTSPARGAAAGSSYQFQAQPSRLPSGGAFDLGGRQLGGGRSGCGRVRRSGGCGWDARDECRGAG